MSEPLIAIIVLNWNGKNDTLECLQSLSLVNYKNCLPIIVDNGSTDGSVAAIRAAFPHVMIIETNKNLGFAGGNNVGIRQALKMSADYITVLNNDTVVAKDMFDIFLKAYQDAATPAVLSPAIYYYSDPERIWYYGAKWTGYSFQHVLFAQCDTNDRGEQYIPTDYAVGCCMFTSSHIFRRVGYFEEKYFLFFEETDWCYRARKMGIPSLVVPAAKLWHKVSASFGGTWSPLRRYYLTRNSLLWARTHLPADIYVRIFAYHLVALIKCIFPHWEDPMNHLPSWKRLLCAGLTFAKRVRWNLKHRGVQAEFVGVWHHLIGRYGDCPGAFKKKIWPARQNLG